MNENNTEESLIKSDAEGGVSGERLYPIYTAKILADLITKHPQQVDINLLNYIVHPEFDELPNGYEDGDNRQKIGRILDGILVERARGSKTQSHIDEAIPAQKRLTAFENQKELQRIVRGTMLTLIKSDIVYAPQSYIEYFEEVKWEYSLDKCKLTQKALDLLSKDVSGELKQIYDRYQSEQNGIPVEDSKEKTNTASILKYFYGGAGGVVKKGITKATEDLISKGIMAIPALAGTVTAFLAQLQ